MTGSQGFFERAFLLASLPFKPEALRGIRVLELATRIFGPATSDYLGEFGAEVIKVELPGTGDLMRYVAPEGFYWQDVSPAFLPQNRNKLHVGVDVRLPEGRDLFTRIAEKSDVVVENLRAGTMDRWGIGYRQLKEKNPGLVYAANSGFGQWGPYAKGRASYDATAQAVSGMSAITGFPGRPPVRVGLWIGDFTGSLCSAIAILASLAARRRTGEGQMIDLAQGEALIRALDWTWMYADISGRDRERAGNRDVTFPPSGIYRCADGFVAISARDDAERGGIAKTLGVSTATPEDVASFAAPRTRAEIVRISEEAGFSAAPVQGGRDQYHNSHLRARGTVWELTDPLYGRIDEFGPVPKLSESPGRIKWTAKPVGYHNEEVFGGLLGLSKTEREELERKKVIGKWADAPGARPPHGEAGGPAGGGENEGPAE
ncbi:MAG TPA: CoA transferase [Candidatus Limnocylindria bacterium]|nr:CoA transferase [Candidatus Limnocylindria bacterium]